MFCPNCGSKVENGLKFCGNCGYQFAPNTASDETPNNHSYGNEGAFSQPNNQPVYQTNGYQQGYQQPNNPDMGQPNNGHVSFGQAIKLYFVNYVNFTGRASKSEYWWAVLFSVLVQLALSWIPVFGNILVPLAFLLPGLSLCIRRLHDIGKAWYYLLMGLIPLAGFIILIVYYCKDSDGNNQWGPGNMM